MNGFTRRHWKSPTFLFVFLVLSAVWLMVVGWVTWYFYHPVMDWIDGQNEIVQELLFVVVLLPWACFMASGIGGAAHVAESSAGLRKTFEPGQSSGQHAKWQRPTRR
jgi:hypothetical protein